MWGGWGFSTPLNEMELDQTGVSLFDTRFHRFHAETFHMTMRGSESEGENEIK
jgi:hypothetical protein